MTDGGGMEDGAAQDGGPGTLSGHWERHDGSEWIPWMDIHLTKFESLTRGAAG